MFKTQTKSVRVLSIIIAILAIVASLGGFLIPDLYQDNNFVTSLWKGNDLVTLAVAVPMLVTALFLSRRGSQRALLIWLAMLDYTLYNYAFYVFGAAFNAFFLIYVALFALSIYALIFGLTSIDVNRISQNFRGRTPVKWISGYMLFVAVGLTIFYVAQSLGFVATAQLPPIVVKTGHPTSVVFALDLSLLVPVFTLGAIWLWKRRPWGYVLASIAVIKGTTYTLVLTVVSIWGAYTGVPGALEEIPVWLVLTVAGLFASLFLLGNFGPLSFRPSISRSHTFQE